MKRIFTIVFLLSLMIPSSAQRTKKTTGRYTYYAPENITLEVAKRTALERAKLTAIADEFGTLVTQNNSTLMTNENGRSDSRFFSLGGSEVKGEWIETTKEPQYDISYEQGTLVVSVVVEGHIREIVSASIDVIAKVLRNGTEEKFESSEFRNGDDMYLYFRSPVDGYLTVYLLDESTQEVFCLLPYRASGDGAYCIQHDRPYILFSTMHEAQNPAIVDEYTMSTSRDIEFNDLYIIFSQNSFAKANVSTSDDEALPRHLSFESFQKWQNKIRGKNNKMTILTKNINIKN